MKYGRYGWPYFWLRAGLGITFLWIGADILRHPELWLGYVPAETPLGLTRESALQLNGAFDIFIGLALLANLWLRIVAWLAVLHLAVILGTGGVDVILIRDVGLLGAALALACWPYHRRRQSSWRGSILFWRNSNNSSED